MGINRYVLMPPVFGKDSLLQVLLSQLTMHAYSECVRKLKGGQYS